MEKPNKEDIMKKWAPILDSMGVTGSKAEWMSEYVEMHKVPLDSVKRLTKLPIK